MTAAAPARPLRALWTVVGLWVVGRAAFLWAGAGPIAPVSDAAPLHAPTADTRPAREVRVLVATAPHGPSFAAGRAPAAPGPGLSAFRPPQVAAQATIPLPIPTLPATSLLTSAVPPGPQPPTAAAPEASPLADPARPAPFAHTALWSGSIWSMARDGSGLGLTPGSGQLGGSQAGLRVYRTLASGLSLTGRVSTALANRQSDAALGIALRRGGLGLIAERRFALDGGGRDDWSITAVAGVSELPLPLRLRLDGYAQAGVVGRDGFADGAIRVERTIMEQGDSRLSLGAGSWGGVQPGSRRLDIGPQIVARSRVAGRSVRVSAEWRQRVAGNASPGSGPVVTLGADF